MQISLIFLGLLFAYIYYKPKSLHPQGRIRNQSLAGVPGGSSRAPKQTLSLFELMRLSLVAMLFFFYVFLIIGKFANHVLIDIYPLCICVGICIQFFFLSAHFWLNVMNFVVWNGFREIKLMGQSQGGNRDRNKRFRMYAAYAWAVPLLMVIITLIMQVHRSIRLIMFILLA